MCQLNMYGDDMEIHCISVDLRMYVFTAQCELQNDLDSIQLWLVVTN